MKTEKERMLAGELYDPLDPVLVEERARVRNLCLDLNKSREEEIELRKKLLREIFGVETDVWIQPPFFCDYGRNIKLGSKVFFNFNCVVLDVMEVTIGDYTLCGPAVQIYTAMHPISAAERRTMKEFAKPVAIGANVWIGGGAIVCPGVSIGERAVIGAGSVVTKNIPAGVFAAGNPCRPIREVPE